MFPSELNQLFSPTNVKYAIDSDEYISPAITFFYTQVCVDSCMLELLKWLMKNPKADHSSSLIFSSLKMNEKTQKLKLRSNLCYTPKFQKAFLL